MAQLTALQVAAAAYLGGFRGNEIEKAVQVAYAESSWDTTQETPCCKGLWQINLKEHGEAVTGDWKDPVHNAYNAHNIYVAAGGWCTRGKPPNCNPWAGYGTSRYNQVYGQAHMALAQLRQQFQGKNEKAVAKQILGNLTSDISPGTPNAIAGTVNAAGDTAASINNAAKAIIDFLNKAGAWVASPDNWIRIVKVVIGGAMVIAGGTIIAKDQALNILPAGKIAKLAKGVVGK